MMYFILKISKNFKNYMEIEKGLSGKTKRMEKRMEGR